MTTPDLAPFVGRKVLALLSIGGGKSVSRSGWLEHKSGGTYCLINDGTAPLSVHVTTFKKVTEMHKR